MLITDLIAQDHRAVRDLFDKLEETSPRDGAVGTMLERLRAELEAHAQAEEAVFYPAVREVSRRIDDAEAGHAHVRRLLAAAAEQAAGSPDFVATIRQLKQSVLNHAAEEEAGVFMDAQRLGLETLERLGADFEARKAEVAQRSARAA
jgi:hemerythrin superfamily protein